MTAVDVIVAALAAGAGAGSSDVAKTAVMDAYTGLRDLLHRRLAGRPQSEQVIEVDEADPQWRTRIGDELAESGADQDPHVLAAAYHLLELADPDGIRDGRYTIRVSGRDGVQAGDGNVSVGTAYGPVAHEMTGPVTVNYGQLPVPPASPAAQ